MNILHIQTDTGLTGGVSNYISTLLTGLDSGCNNFVTVSNIDINGIIKYKNSQLILMPASYSLFSILNYIYLLNNIIKKNNINIIHAHALRAGLAVSLLKIFCDVRFVFTNHGLRFLQKKSIYKKSLFLLLELFTLYKSDKYVCISNSSYSIIKCFSPKYKIALINTRLNIKPRLSLPKSRDKILITGVGSILDIKGIYNFINIAKELKSYSDNFIFEWYGGGPDIKKYKEYARLKNINIIWHGQKENEELLNGLQKSSLLLVTSEFEVMPFCILEAYACNLLVFSNNFKFSTDFIQNGFTGITFDTSKIGCSATLIIKILSDETKRNFILTNAMKFYLNNHFDSILMSKQYQGIYNL